MASRLSVIDGLKVLASQTIVLHHLASYGPIADAAHTLSPEFFGWLFGYGRMAVQIFLVAGGFLAARSLAPACMLIESSLIDLFTRRYIRLAVPLMAAVVVAVLTACLARGIMVDEAIPAAPGLFQFLAHLFLLHDLLGVPALSAGVWYVAIDFQLYSLTILLLWIARRAARSMAWTQCFGMAALSALAVSSLFFFNRDAAWDVAAPYHFAAYSMGMFCFWLTRKRELPVFWICVVVLAALASLAVDFRLRLAVALAVAFVIGIYVRTGLFAGLFAGTWVKRLSRESYSLFLVHFPVCLLVNAVFARVGGDSSVPVLLALLIAWALSMALASVFHRKVEARSDHVLSWLGSLGLRQGRPIPLSQTGG